MTIFYYGCEFLYTAAITWIIFCALNIQTSQEMTNNTARTVTTVIIALLKIYNTSIGAGLFSNVLIWFFVTVIALVSKIIYKNKFLISLLTGCTFWGLIAIGDLFVQTVMYTLFGKYQHIECLLKISICRGIYLICWTGIFSIIIGFWIPKAKQVLAMIFKHHNFIFLFNLMLMCCLVYFQRIYLFHASEEVFRYWWMFILGLIIIFSLVIICWAKEKENSQKKILKMKVEMLEKQYQQIMRERREKDILLHDTRNHLLAIARLAENGKNEEIKAYIEDINHILNQRENHTLTGHVFLDLILNSKVEEAKASGIRIEIESDDLSEICLKDIEISALFSNLLDNAIEANERMEGNRKGWIKILCHHRHRLLIINIINPTDSISIDGGVLRSSKKDKEFHGLGLLSVQKVVDIYKGYIKYDIQDGVFCIRICLTAFEG